jgi:hypothetical protein
LRTCSGASLLDGASTSRDFNWHPEFGALWARATTVTGSATSDPAQVVFTRGLPVFVKAGAILPTQADVDRLSDEPPAELWLDLYPEGESCLVLNDGLDLASRITCRQIAGKVEVQIANALPTPRTFRIRLHAVPAGTRLVVNGKEVAGESAIIC